jgi:hypothetical protein
LTESSGFDRVTELPGSIFFLNQNDIVLVKKTKSTGCNLIFDRVLMGQPPGHTGFFFLYFSFNSVRFQLRVDLLGRAGFKTISKSEFIYSSQYIPFIIGSNFFQKLL